MLQGVSSHPVMNAQQQVGAGNKGRAVVGGTTASKHPQAVAFMGQTPPVVAQSTLHPAQAFPGGFQVQRGSWTFERDLGTGGFGCVKLWKDGTTGQRLAVKQCRPGWKISEKNKQRWRAECSIMLKLDHPNVVRAVKVPPELEVNGDLPALAMEFCSGGDLRRMLMKPQHYCGLPEMEVRSVAKDISGAVEYLHKLNIIHRDLKPENIILRKEGEERMIYKLIDLGYAKDLDKESICQSFVGTMQYVAPELFKQERYTRTVDYWSFGTLLFEIISGFRPFQHTKSLVQWHQDLSKKKDTHICSYLNMSGHVELSSQLPTPNRLCRTSVDAFQQLLYLLLMWDPSTRGGGLNNSQRPNCFELLDQIMSVKIIQILCVPTNEVFSYPITSATKSLQEIMSVLERESKIPVREQELLLATGVAADPAQSPNLCQADTDDSISMAYLFRKGETTFPHNKRQQKRYPPLVAAMMTDSKASMVYEERRKVWGQSVHFIGEVVRDYKRLADAQKAAMLCLLRFNTKFSRLKTKMATMFSALETKIDFFSQSFEYDKKKFEEQAKTGVFSNRMHMTWVNMWEEIKQAEELRSQFWNFDQQCTALGTKIMELQRSPYTRTQHEQPLEAIEEEAITLYDKLKKLPQEERKKAADNIPMVQCVLKCLNQRTRMTNDLYLHIGKVTSCRVDIIKLCPPVEEMVRTLEAHSNKVLQYQKQRQKDVWRLLAVASQQSASNRQAQNTPSQASLSMLSGDSSSTAASIRQSQLDRLSDAAQMACEDNRLARNQLSTHMSEVRQEDVRAPSVTDLDWDFIQAEVPVTNATSAWTHGAAGQTAACWDTHGPASNV